VTIKDVHTPVLWRISDGRSGHDSQSKGLVKALNQIKPCDCHDIELAKGKYGILDLLYKKFPLTEQLPDPDLIIGAGHHTHLPILCARRARGGKAVVIMKPSIPASCFDFCLIPEHDSPRMADNIFTTKGAINCITPATEHADDRGLILIGGPSRHFSWDNEYLLQQIKEIMGSRTDVKWEISDSARTPEETKKSLAALREENAEYKEHSSTGSDWIVRRLNVATNTWVSGDSVSMIYESLTAGLAVGLLDIPSHGTSKLTNNLAGLVEDNMVTSYNKWLTIRKLHKPPVMLNEAKRCAEHLYATGLLR